MLLVYQWAAVNAQMCAGDRTPPGLGRERPPLLGCVCLCDVAGLWGSDDTEAIGSSSRKHWQVEFHKW